MRIAILISTQVRGSIEKINLNLNLLQDAFPDADFVLGLWSYEEHFKQHFEDRSKKIVLIDEPHIHYHPYNANPNAIQNWNYQKKLINPNERHMHQTKQILAHNELMKCVKNDYDIIIRSRWDATVSPLVDYSPFVDECFNTPCTIAISTRRDYHTSIMSIGETSSWKFPYLNHKTGNDDTKITQSSTCQMLLDNGIIIHRSCDWNIELVESLHMNSKLLAAEFGWWQVLVDGTSHKQWIHYDGGAAISRTLIKSDREILKKYESLCYNNH